MGCFVPEGTPCAKGPIPYHLDLCSRRSDARERLTALSDAIKRIAPTYEGLADVFDTYLMAGTSADDRLRASLRDHLANSWFNDGPDSFFPGQRVAQKYAEAVLKTIELSLHGKSHPVPINAWWIIHSDKEVKMLNLAECADGVTVSSSVTLLIMTPRPASTGAPVRTPILGDFEAWVTEQRDGAVITRQIEKNPRRD